MLTRPSRCASSVDLVLLSHGDLQHSGLYAYAYSHWGLRAPTYATLPVQATARIATIEEAESIRGQEDVSQPPAPAEGNSNEEGSSSTTISDSGRKFIATLDEIRDAYDTMNTLRFSQPTHLQGKLKQIDVSSNMLLTNSVGKCQGITITAFNAGHTLGGTMWKIRSPSAGTILYALNVNHLKERHLDGTVLLKGAGSSGVYETLARPDLFITDADRVNNISCRKKDRDAQLIGTRNTVHRYAC